MRVRWILVMGLLAACGDKDDDTGVSTDDSGDTEVSSDDTGASADDTEGSTDDSGEESRLSQSVDDAPDEVELETVYDMDASAAVSEEDMSGALTYLVDRGGALICDAQVSIAGTKYAGDCVDCDFAFDVVATIDSDGGLPDCDFATYLTYVETHLIAPIMAFSPVYTYQSYYGSYTYYNALRTGVSADYTDSGGGFYPGPYWNVIAYDEGPYGEAVYDGQGALDWTFDLSDTSWERTYYQDCGGGEFSQETEAFAGEQGLGDVDCDGDTVDLWDITLAAGEVLTVSLDTVGADSTFDPGIELIDPSGCTVVVADDSFDCTFPPANYSCPSLRYEAQLDGAHRVLVKALGQCAGDRASYSIHVDGAAP